MCHRKPFSELDIIMSVPGQKIGLKSAELFERLPPDTGDGSEVTLFRILKISKTGSIEEIAKFQSSIVTGFDIILYIFSIYPGKDKTGSRSADNIKREFAEKSIHGCPFHGI